MLRYRLLRKTGRD